MSVETRTEKGEAELIGRARRGDRSAFATLYDRHVRTVYRYAWRIVGTDADAEDVTQEVFITAWKRLKDIAVVDASILPWLLVTARFTSLNHIRDRRRHEHGDDTALLHVPSTAPGPEQEISRLKLERAIADAIGRLSETDQQLYQLCIEQKLTYDQAARTLGVSHATVRNRLSRLRAGLRERLREGLNS